MGRLCLDHAPVKVRGRHFSRIARQRPGMQIIEPAGTQIVPRPIGYDLVVPDAMLSGLGKSSVRELKHAERAGGRAIKLERVPRPLSAPIGASDRISTPFELSQGGKQFRRKFARRMLLEQ